MDLTNLISYWGLDEASGSRADRHGTNTMSEAGTVGTTTGLVYPLAANLSGTNGFFINDNASLSVSGATQEYTLCSWVKLGSIVGTQEILSKGDDPNKSYLLEYNSGSSRFEFSTYEAAGLVNGHSVIANSLGAPSTGIWYFIIAWRESNGVMKIQVNDGTVDTGGTNATAYDDPGEFDMGFTNNLGNNLTAVIGPILFWKRVLSAAERTELYNGGAGLTYAAMSGAPPATGLPFITTIGAKRI
jgi:hypothetical protein